MRNTYCTEEQSQNKLRKWVYEHHDTQKQAAKKLGTTPAHLGHVLNHRKALTKKMQKAIGLEREVVIRYKKAA